MLRHITNMQKVAVYLGIVFFLELMLLVLPIELNTALFMFVPLVSVLLTMLLTREVFSKDGWKQLGFHRFGGKFFFVGLLVPLIPILVGYSLIWVTGLAEFGLAAEYQGKTIELIITFFMTLIFGSLTVTLGEEVGWRGYLAVKLEQLGLVKCLLLTGFIWSLFHLPVILFTDLYHDGVNLYIYLPMFIITVTLAGAFMTYVRIATGSIWPAIIAHTSHNLFWNYGELFTQHAKPIVTYLTGDAGIVLIIFYLIVFGWIVKRERTVVNSSKQLSQKLN